MSVSDYWWRSVDKAETITTEMLRTLIEREKNWDGRLPEPFPIVLSPSAYAAMMKFLGEDTQ